MRNNLSTEKLYIQTFGSFNVSGLNGRMDEEDIRSEMLTRLLAYMACHRRKELSVQELAEVLWQDEESDNPAGALKNLVYRLRSMMKKIWPDREFIQTGRGAYKWNDQLPVQVDIEEFEKCCDAAAKTEDGEEQFKLYMRAIELYKGQFLPKMSGEFWAASMAAYFHSSYLTVVKAAAELLESMGRYDEMDQVCNYALQLESLDEDLHSLRIRALIRQNKLKLAEEQYRKAADILYENLGVAPSDELRKVYQELLKQTHEVEKNISAIQKELNDGEVPGAFLCEYGVFKKTYQLEKRRSERLGISVYLSLITVVPRLNLKPGTQAYLNIVNEGMAQLEAVLLKSLRAGDALSRYSGTQYIVLLPTCQYETAKMVMKRIEQAFLEASRKKPRVGLQFSLDELDISG